MVLSHAFVCQIDLESQIVSLRRAGLLHIFIIASLPTPVLKSEHGPVAVLSLVTRAAFLGGVLLNLGKVIVVVEF